MSRVLANLSESLLSYIPKTIYLQTLQDINSIQLNNVTSTSEKKEWNLNWVQIGKGKTETFKTFIRSSLFQSELKRVSDLSQVTNFKLSLMPSSVIGKNNLTFAFGMAWHLIHSFTFKFAHIHYPHAHQRLTFNTGIPLTIFPLSTY